MHKNISYNNSPAKAQKESSKEDPPKQHNRPKNNNRNRNYNKNHNKNQRNKGHVYGVVDLGTNNCRLLVAIPHQNGFRVIDSFSRIVRLGEGLKEEKRISDQAIERTVSALKICMDKMKRRGVTRMWNVATQACREAENGDHFVKTIEEQVKIKLDNT